MLQLVNLGCTVCYFDTVIYCNMIATDTILSHYIIIVPYYSLHSSHCALDLHGLFSTHYKFVPLTAINHILPHSLVTTTPFCFFFFFNKSDLLLDSSYK